MSMTGTNHITEIEFTAEITGWEPLLNRIRGLSRRRLLWLKKQWGAVGGVDEVESYLLLNDDPDEEANWYATAPAMQQLGTTVASAEEVLSANLPGRLNKLISLFNLNEQETDLVHACLAHVIDPNLGKVYAFLQDNTGRSYVTAPLMARLFSHGHAFLIATQSPLKEWCLIQEIELGRSEPPRFELDPFIRDWLLGADELDPAIAPVASIQPVLEPLEHWPVEATVANLKVLHRSKRLDMIRVAISGAEGSGRKTFAAAVAKRLGWVLLSIDASGLHQHDWKLLYRKAQRQSLLTGFSLLWKGDSVSEFQWPAILSGIQFIVMEHAAPFSEQSDAVDLEIVLPPITASVGRKLLPRFVPAAASWTSEKLEALTQRYHLTIGQIVQLGRLPIHEEDDFITALRKNNRIGTESLAHQLSSEFRWEDLVVNENQMQILKDFHFEATERDKVWENEAIRRLFPQGRGLLALFSGAPGTGKTMAAQVMANSLGLDLLRVDLSAMMSKYIGDTAKNISRVLDKASRMNVILLFDEADALFGKRTEIKDAHDKYANTDTNFLLQAIEEYPGIAILASNRKLGIDTGFVRRIRFIVDFPKPDSAARFRLWRNLVAALAGESDALSMETSIKKLAELIELTGAQIKLSILSAIYLARRDGCRIELHHLLRGVERELAKEERGLGKQVQQWMAAR